MNLSVRVNGMIDFSLGKATSLEEKLNSNQLYFVKKKLMSQPANVEELCKYESALSVTVIAEEN